MARQKDSPKDEPHKSQDNGPYNEPDFSPHQAEWDELQTHPDFVQFVNIQFTTGELDSATIADADEPTKQAIMGKYHAWIQAGRPKPHLDVKAGAPEQILAVYRVKWYGKQKLAWKISGRETLGGMRKEPQYRKLTDPNGNTIDDKSTVIGYKTDYTQDYTKDIAEQLVQRCMRESPTPQMYFKVGAYTVSVKDPANFTGDDFDALMMKARKDVI